MRSVLRSCANRCLQKGYHDTSTRIIVLDSPATATSCLRFSKLHQLMQAGRNPFLLFNRLGSMLTSCEKCHFFFRNALGASQVGECTCFHPCVSSLSQNRGTHSSRLCNRPSLLHTCIHVWINNKQVYCDEKSNHENILKAPLAG